MADSVLSIRELTVKTVSRRRPRTIIKQVSFDLYQRETLCIVGESGSGKSVSAYSIIGLLPADALRTTGGKILMGEQDLLKLSQPEILKLRATQIGMVFQEPMTALNPVQRVGAQLDEMVRTHRKLDSAARREMIFRMLAEVDLPDPERIYRAFPHELSGGQRQRIIIAMALMLEPQILIADEPTTALDVTTQKQILGLMKRLQERHGTAIIFITHDFGVVAEIADRILVMRDGEMVETGSREQILTAPREAYTRQLVASVPSLTPPPARANREDVILQVRKVSAQFGKRSIVFKNRTVLALDEVSVSLRRNEVLGIVGESGSGKSTLARCIVGLMPDWTGEISLADRVLKPASRKRAREVKKKIQIVFQDPYRSLNPRRRILDSLIEGPVNFGMPRQQAVARVRQILGVVGMDEDTLGRYPHQFSGGQRQRLCLARAIVMEPDVLVADEATSALDVTVQEQVLELIAEIKQRTGVAIVFITHDLRVASQIADRLVVMQNGRIVERGTPEQILNRPAEPYTRALIDAAPGAEWDFRNFRKFQRPRAPGAATHASP